MKAADSPAPAVAGVPTAGAADPTAAIRRWALRLAALCVPIGEGATFIPAVLALVAWGAGAVKRPPSATVRQRFLRRAGLPVVLLALGIAGWVVWGVVGAWHSGFVPHSLNMNKVITASAVFLGVMLVLTVDSAERRRLFAWLLAGLAIAAVAGLCQYLWGHFPFEALLHSAHRGRMGQLYVPGSATRRAATGTLRNRLKLSEVLVFGIAAVWAAWGAVTSHRRRWLLAAAFVVLGIVLRLTFARAAAGAIAVGLVASWALEHRASLRRFLGPALALGFVAAMAFDVHSAVTYRGTTVPHTESTWQMRRWIWTQTLDIARRHPLMGTGLGTYTEATLSLEHGLTSAQPMSAGSHNQHLTALAEGGAVGMVFWLAICVAVGLLLHRLWQLDASQLGADGVVWRRLVTPFLLAMYVMSFVHDVLFHPLTALLFWSCVGICIGLAGTRRPVDPPVAAPQ